MEAFWALEDIKRHEAEVKQMFIYQGRAGLWDDYCKFIANRKELRRKAQEREKAKKLARKKAIKNGLVVGAVLVGSLTLIGTIILMLMWILQSKGRA